MEKAEMTFRTSRLWKAPVSVAASMREDPIPVGQTTATDTFCLLFWYRSADAAKCMAISPISASWMTLGWTHSRSTSQAVSAAA